ncbi:hypothetical protein AB1Y20_019664 [Prymnesium parvum]|uniref:Nucleotide-diphospho-sugar transferase domain-containing protein n=1 Tax=Prymnesium parvum TaxID=97485 RepID=A0AB34JV44_PRYPA
MAAEGTQSLASLAMSTLRPKDRAACSHLSEPSALGLPPALSPRGSQPRTPPLPPLPPLSDRMLWLTAISPPLNQTDTVGAMYAQLAKAAVLSARLHAPSLQPHLMYLTDCTHPPSAAPRRTCGEADALTRWMTRHRVRVHFWRLSFWDSLPDIIRKARNPMTFNSYGTYAKLDAPLLVEQLRRAEPARLPPTEYVLYTDLDVLFTADPRRALLSARPRLLAAAPDLLAHGINSGVVLFNTSGFAEQHQPLLAFGRKHSFRLGLMEQGLLNHYFAMAHQTLSEAFNMRSFLRCLPPAGFAAAAADPSLLCDHNGSEARRANSSAEAVPRQWDGHQYAQVKASEQRPKSVFLSGGKYLNAAPPRCDEGFLWHFHGFKPWEAHAWFARLKRENENGIEHEGADGIPAGWERFPSNVIFCDRCFLIKTAHIVAAWDDLLELAERREYEEQSDASEQQSIVVQIPVR